MTIRITGEEEILLERLKEWLEDYEVFSLEQTMQSDKIQIDGYPNLAAIVLEWAQWVPEWEEDEEDSE